MPQKYLHNDNQRLALLGLAADFLFYNLFLAFTIAFFSPIGWFPVGIVAAFVIDYTATTFQQGARHHESAGNWTFDCFVYRWRLGHHLYRHKNFIAQLFTY